MLEWMQRPHRRRNPLTGDFVLVSPQRVNRPWQGMRERPAAPGNVAYDPACYLCPGNERSGKVRNPSYTSTFVFDNDFPAIVPDTAKTFYEEQGLLIAQTERGICRVICFSPRHDLAVPSLDTDALRAVVETWREQNRLLSILPFVGYVQIFENRGAVMGASNPHPHCQIWATESIPTEILKEEVAQRRYEEDRHACLLCDYLKVEHNGERSVCQNNSFYVVVPFWAAWPFETLVLSKRHVHGLDALSTSEAKDLAGILRDVTKRYDALFGVPFPYSMGFHQRPTRNVCTAWHMHAHYYPPLLRSAEVRKFMVGYEMLAEPQRDLTPESAALVLRNALN
jgi:UDPglucose--hexose-1-phosphate uridylyltransferase